MRELNTMAVTLLCVLVFGCENLPPDTAKTTPDTQTENETGDAETPPFKFSTKGFNHAHWQSDRIVFKLVADEMTRQSLRGHFFTFDSYDELQLTNVILNQSIAETAEFIGFDANEFSSLNNPNTNNEESEQLPETKNALDDNVAANQMLMSPKLSRIVGKPVKVNFQPGTDNDKDIIFSANEAVLNIASMNIEFSGNVELKSESCKVRSERAIWLNKDYGFIFENDTTINRKRYFSPKFVKITRTGKCLVQRRLPDYSNQDIITETETRLLNSLPIEYRMLIGLAGLPASALEQ